MLGASRWNAWKCGLYYFSSQTKVPVCNTTVSCTHFLLKMVLLSLPISKYTETRTLNRKFGIQTKFVYSFTEQRNFSFCWFYFGTRGDVVCSGWLVSWQSLQLFLIITYIFCAVLFSLCISVWYSSSPYKYINERFL
jgi:hypothetical protein